MPEKMHPEHKRDPELDALIARSRELRAKSKASNAESAEISKALAEIDNQIKAHQQRASKPSDRSENST